ncbi:MAG: hypothetical protein ACYS9C_13905 [Planctomycetota bacterium]|jgi:hypothetical protein
MKIKGNRTKILKGIVIAVVVVLVISAFAVFVLGDALDYLVIRGFVFFGVREAKQMKMRLLCETDHQALLEACRELSRRAAAGDLKHGMYYVRSDSQPPQPILDLGPNHVFIRYDGRVMLEMMGGLDHFGVYAYPEDYKEPPVMGFELGDKELIDGLWYYDDGYLNNPEYDKPIEALLQKRK